MVAREPRHIIADLTASPAQVAYEFRSMFELHECSTEEGGELTVITLAKVEHAIAFAIGTG
ncbi:hypothetical protein ASE83_14030 [Sphingomonas sp. Leaf32]|nr:hypothetical protein ASE83_14030 [Sphingomonas sp. Leaf32]